MELEVKVRVKVKVQVQVQVKVFALIGLHEPSLLQREEVEGCCRNSAQGRSG